jgi:DMSO/TMAO reductase YedYZ heme-binding membrane subunit
MKDTRFSKLLLLINGLVPLVLLLWDVYRKQVGANPLEFVTRTTGMLTLVFLMITLAITPVRQVYIQEWTYGGISNLGARHLARIRAPEDSTAVPVL